MQDPSPAAQPRIAVITTVLNERQAIAVLLDGFLAQTRMPDEIVVVDGGSTDGTIEVLKDYARRHPAIRLQVAPGVNIARGRNIAIHLAQADIIAVTDGGCRLVPHWLEALVAPLLADEGIDAVTGARHVEHVNEFERFAGMLSTSGNAAREQDRVFHGRNSAFRKRLWTAVGGYPEWLYTAEDTLFALRAKSLGCRVAVAEQAVVSWRPRPNLRKLAKQYYLYGRGTGRIGMADAGAIRYHLRNHALWMALLLGSLIQPLLLLPTLVVLVYLHRLMAAPLLAELRFVDAGPWARLYVPLIVGVRSIAGHLGQWRGLREYRGTAGFADNLRAYREGRWRMAAFQD